MESETKRNSILPQIVSDDLIEQILLRLPVRSLSRFKCVCKSWLSIISDPQFAKSHFDLAAAPTHRVFLYLSNNSQLNSVDIDTAINYDSAQAVFNNPLPSPLPQFPFSLHVVGSCRGFVLLTNTYLSEISYSRSTELGRNIDFVIWNPSTGFQKIVNTVYHSFPHLYGIGYDSSTDDYVVVIITMPWRTNGQFLFNTMVHCLSLRTNSWTRVVGTATNDHLGLVSGEMHEFRHGVLLNRSLHWLVESIHNDRVIVAFDVMEKSLTEIPVPSELALASQFKTYHLRVMGECLCLCFAGRGTMMPEIWVMKDYKVQSSWTNMFVQLPNNDPVLSHFSPICFTKNGEILGSNGRNVVVRFNDKGELLQNRAIGQEMNIYRSIHNGMYRESLLSLPFDEATQEEATEEEH